MAEVKGRAVGLDAKLAELAAKLTKKTSLRVGFLENATYPATEGNAGVTHVATIAAIQNYGAPGKGIPPRPFFSGMVVKNSPTWGDDLGKLLAANGGDSQNALELMGHRMVDQLQQSIRDTNDPPLSILTLMARKHRRDGGTVTGATLGALANERRKGPPDLSGVSTKPLIDTSVLLMSADFEVK